MKLFIAGTLVLIAACAFKPSAGEKNIIQSKEGLLLEALPRDTANSYGVRINWENLAVDGDLNIRRTDQFKRVGSLGTFGAKEREFIDEEAKAGPRDYLSLFRGRGPKLQFCWLNKIALRGLRQFSNSRNGLKFR